MNIVNTTKLQKRYTERHDLENVSWQHIADETGVNVAYLYNFAMHRIEPTNPEIRARLGLDPKCPKCKRPITITPLIKSQGDETMYQQIIADTPTDLEKLILQILSKKVGKENAFKRADLLPFICSIPGFEKTQDRQLRHVINDLRKQGHLICSMASEDGGYYQAASLEEFDEFVRREFGAKISDMAETVREMEKAAQDKFGNSFQPNLI